MINVSTEFKELMKSRTDFKQYAEITLVDGAVWALDDSDFRITSNSVKDGVDADGLPLGVVAGRTIKMTFQNTDEQFKDVAFLGAEIRLYLTFQLSATIEKIELGTFTVISPEDYGETISIQAVDNSWKLDKDYTTGLSFPQTISSMFRDACSRCNVLFESASFRNNDFVVDALPEDVGTFREAIGYIAMIAGGNARFNRSGKLEILTYEFPAFDVEEERNYDGGTFDDWDSGDTLDGGTFDDWDSGDDADGGAFDPWDSSSGSDSGNIVVDDDTHVLTNWISLKPFTEDIIITGIQTTKTVEDGEGNETQGAVKYGTDGYVLSIENPLIKGREEAALALIGDVLIGAHIRNFEGEHIGYPLAEFMDKAVIVDRKGNAMPTVLTDINFNFFGVTTMANSAAPPLRLSSKYNSAAAQAIIAAKDLVAKEKTQRELAIENLNQTLKTSSGLYTTKELQPDGSTISYLHDKPTLEESQTVIKVTAEAIGVSNDGGDTYTYGFFTNGDAILNVLQAKGINADWINTGTLTGTDSDGNVQFSFDVTTGNHWVNGDSVKINLGGTETDAQTQIAANATGVSQVTSRLNNNYSTTTQIQSMIDDSAASIELSVTQKVTDTVGDIAQSEAQEAVSASLNLYVKKNDNDQIVSMLEASADEINISGNRISIESDDFKLTTEGEITATAGTIGGFTIGERKLESYAGNYPIVLDNLNGEITAGNLTMSGGGTNIGQIGITNSLGGSYIIFREDSGNYGLTLYAATGKKIRLYSPTYFSDDVEFTGNVTFRNMPTYPSALTLADTNAGAAYSLPARSSPVGDQTVSARETVSVPGEGYQDVTINYGHTFSMAPAVALSVCHNSDARITAQLRDEPGLSNCVVRVFSDASGSLDVPVTVIAVGN